MSIAITQWEYQQIQGYNLEGELNQLGEQGWQAVSAGFRAYREKPGSPRGEFLTVVLLKRPLQQPRATAGRPVAGEARQIANAC